MQMKRYPHGVEGEFFYQKRVPVPHPDWLETVHIVFPGSGRTADFPVVTDAAGLAFIANLGCIELHTWHSRVDDVERPDYMLIDLDPSEGNPWKHVRRSPWSSTRFSRSSGSRASPRRRARPACTSSSRSRRELRFPDVRRFAKALAPGGRAADRRPGRRDDDVEGGRPTRRLRRLRPELPRPHDRLRVLDPAHAGRPRLGAASLGRGRRRRARGVHDPDDARPGRRRSATSRRACGSASRASSRASRSSSSNRRRAIDSNGTQCHPCPMRGRLFLAALFAAAVLSPRLRRRGTSPIPGSTARRLSTRSLRPRAKRTRSSSRAFRLRPSRASPSARAYGSPTRSE